MKPSRGDFSRQIFLCAGDVSGDAHCALLMREIRARHPDWRLCVVGGVQMQECADEVVGDARGLGVMGVVAVYSMLPRFVALHHRARRWLRNNQIDAALLCDWGAFNRRLLPHLNQRNVPVGYYFPPRSWHKSGPGASGFAPLVKWFATPFEWDAARLQGAGARAEWVGHPLLEIVRAAPPRAELRKSFGAAADEKLVALLPGSRSLELKYIAPHLAATARLLQSIRPRCAGHPEFDRTRFVVATPHGVALPRAFANVPNLIHAPGRATHALLACDAAIVKSGTATLEAALCDAPQIVVYEGPPLFRFQYLLLKKKGAIPFAAMPNIIAKKFIVPEMLGPNCRAPRLVGELQTLLQGDKAREMRENYRDIRRALGEGLPQTATARTVSLIEELVSKAQSDAPLFDRSTVEIDRTSPIV